MASYNWVIYFKTTQIITVLKLKKERRKLRYYKIFRKSLYRAQQLMIYGTSSMQPRSWTALADICKFVWYVIRSGVKFAQNATGKTEILFLRITSSEVYYPKEHCYSSVTMKDHQMMYIPADLHYRDHIVQFKCILFHDTESYLFICNYCADT